ncbi:oxidoreductase NAD-binding domain-containing protein 1 [Achaetomium macrosporum]|uniref:Oxidoreductase NAD-binding domain-containing protein 1 n=1 Tax=Achaetomium macrosporum TaxID=79813 RepID=A0AAN7CHN7_9PEZI|nr:oxidoreductase NAD-binding domain-containing protein 1 [Achaetomium macrosporum]
MTKQSHIERTANEPRDPSLHTITISCITEVTPTIRLFRLDISPNDSIKFLPGQWVDLYPPANANVPKPGGFTITSSPSLAQPSSSPPHHPATILARSPDGSGNQAQHVQHGYIELAIQASPLNPAAAYLFRPTPQLLHTQVRVRIGGSFTFPPPSLSEHVNASLRKVVFVAGGMGINPLMSMLSWLGEQGDDGRFDAEVRVLYSVKDPRGMNSSNGNDNVDGDGVVREGREILFLERIVELFKAPTRLKGGLRLFLTGSEGDRSGNDKNVVKCADGVEVPFMRRRMAVKDVEEALGCDKEDAVAYVCGVPAMTDEFVQALVSPGGFGMDEKRVLFEKWW